MQIICLIIIYPNCRGYEVCAFVFVCVRVGCFCTSHMLIFVLVIIQNDLL